MELVIKLLALPRIHKRIISILVDTIGLVLVAHFAVWLRFGEFVHSHETYEHAIYLLPIVALPVFIVQGLYRAVIRYIGEHFVITVLTAVSLVFIIWAAAIFMFDLQFPRSAIVIAWLLGLVYIAATRLLARWLFTYGKSTSNKAVRRVVVFGAGASGKQLAAAMIKLPTIKIVGFIDDDKSILRHEIHSVKVFAREDLSRLIEQHGVSEVFLAIPSISAQKRKQILEWLEPFPTKVSTLPSMDEILSGNVSFSDIREVQIEDLLGRDSVPPRPELLSRCITNQAVMVSGAGGSIGSELCRKVLRQAPKTIILYELSELALYTIEQELRPLCTAQGITLIAILGSVCDAKKLAKV